MSDHGNEENPWGRVVKGGSGEAVSLVLWFDPRMCSTTASEEQHSMLVFVSPDSDTDIDIYPVDRLWHQVEIVMNTFIRLKAFIDHQLEKTLSEFRVSPHQSGDHHPHPRSSQTRSRLGIASSDPNPSPSRSLLLLRRDLSTNASLIAERMLSILRALCSSADWSHVRV